MTNGHDDTGAPRGGGEASGNHDEHDRDEGRRSRRAERADRDRDDWRSACGGGESGHRRRRHRRRHHRHGGRKERVLHTRISDQLADDIRRLADDLRVPTSNLVRNVLEEVFAMVESVSDDVGELFEDVLDEAQEARERVRRRAARQRHRGRGSHFDGSVEDELRRDEAREAGDAGDVGEAGPSSGAGAPWSDEVRADEPVREPSQEPKTFDDVLGWQPLVLNHPRQCAGCGVELRRGVHAYIGLGRQGLTDTTVCRACAGTRS